jgi:hypothetical protein
VNPLHCFPQYFLFKAYFDIKIVSMCRSCKWPLAFRFSDQTFVCLLFSYLLFPSLLFSSLLFSSLLFSSLLFSPLLFSPLSSLLSPLSSSLCLLPYSCWFLIWLIIHPEKGRNMFLRNVGFFSTDYTALYTRRQNSS